MTVLVARARQCCGAMQGNTPKHLFWRGARKQNELKYIDTNGLLDKCWANVFERFLFFYETFYFFTFWQNLLFYVFNKTFFLTELWTNFFYFYVFDKTFFLCFFLAKHFISFGKSHFTQFFLTEVFFFFW